MALTNLGITNATSQDHQTHFHVYLQPPQALEIGGGTHALLADDSGAGSSTAGIPSANALSESTTNNQEMLMLDYFVPPQSGAEPPALIAQASPSKLKTLKPFTFCQDVGSDNPDSAWNDFSVFGNGELSNPKLIPNYKVRLLKVPEHGQVVFADDARTPVGDTATTFKSSGLTYLPTLDYVGKDRAVFLVEANNKQYQVTVNFWVMPFVTDENTGDTYCKSQKFSLNSPTQQSPAAWLASAELSSLLSAASGVTYGFSELLGAAVANTTGEGANAAITLDTTAAGHGWYIDPTPLDNTDEYLPTSNPNIWQAKAGTDAAGKMDMLSVLLHEYGHAVGLEHSADAYDFMATTLQPGERRRKNRGKIGVRVKLP